MALSRIRKAIRSLLIVCLVLPTVLSGCGPQASTPTVQYEASVATAWFDLYLNLVQNTQGFTPPVASRAFGYAGITLYEAVAPGMPESQSLAGQLNGLAPLPQPTGGAVYHWPAVANSALADIARKLFANATPESIAAIDALESKLATALKSQPAPAIFDRSAAHGRAVAEAIFEWSKTDGGHEGYLWSFPTDYGPPG